MRRDFTVKILRACFDLSLPGKLQGRVGEESGMEAVQGLTLSPDEGRYLRQVIKDRSGVSFSADDASFLEDRLFSVARENGFSSLSQLVKALHSGRQGLSSQVISAIMTHDTSFFRDEKPFEFFAMSLAPYLLKAKKKSGIPLRIWSMGCSTGQEPYSIALILKEAGIQEGDVEIFATDISSVVIDQARRGVYTEADLCDGLSEHWIKNFFKPLEGDFQLEASVRHLVKFQVFNLLDDFVPFGEWDVIFCRNVLKLFEPLTRTRILDRISTVLSKEGTLFLGINETVLGLSDRYDLVEGVRGAYKQAQVANLMKSL